MKLELTDNERSVLENAVTHYYDHIEWEDEDRPVVETLLEKIGALR